MNKCYTFNISTNALVPKQNMNQPRSGHGLQKIAHKIFAFGGFDFDDESMKSAEFYDVVENSWNNLPDMLQSGNFITCVRV